MSKQVQRRRGSSSQHTNFTGAVGEITVDTTNNRPIIHDGTLAGGYTGVIRDDLWQNGYPFIRSSDGVGVFTSSLTQASIISPVGGGINVVFNVTADRTLIRDQSGVQGLRIISGSTYVGSGTSPLVSNSPNGFLNLPTMTGNPTNYSPNTLLGYAPVVFSTGSSRLYVFNSTGKWWYAQLTST